MAKNTFLTLRVKVSNPVLWILSAVILPHQADDVCWSLAVRVVSGSAAGADRLAALRGLRPPRTGGGAPLDSSGSHSNGTVFFASGVGFPSLPWDFLH